MPTSLQPGPFVASNESIAFVAVRPEGEDSDPFNLREGMRSFKAGFKSQKNGPHKYVELTIALPSLAVERSIFSNIAKGGQKYEFVFGWDNAIGKSKILKATLISANYSMNLGQEVVIKMMFASPDDGLAKVDNLVFDKDSKAILAGKVSLKEFGAAEGIEELLKKALSFESVSCIVESTSIKPQTAFSIGKLKKSIMKGFTPQEDGGSGDKMGPFTGKGEYTDLEVGLETMDENYAQDQAIFQFFEESPFIIKLPDADEVSNPEDLEGMLYTKHKGWGEDYEVRDNTQDDTGHLQQLSTPQRSNTSILLGRPPKTPNVPAQFDNKNFSPLIEGPSEYLHKLSEAKLIFNKTATLPKWEEQYSGRYEFWVQGQQQIILNTGQRNLALWDRDDGLGWITLAPTLDYALRNLTLMGTDQESIWSDSMFEVPTQDVAVEDEHGQGTWFFRLTKTEVAKIIVETCKMQARADQINDLNTAQFYPPPGGLASEDSQYDPLNFLFSDDPFNIDAMIGYADGAPGGGEGGGEGGGGGDEGGDKGGTDTSKDAQLMLSVKEGDTLSDFLNRYVVWQNEIIGDNGPQVGWKLIHAAELQEEGKAMDVDPEDLVVYIANPQDLPGAIDKSAPDLLRKIKSYPWISPDGIDITLWVGGWQSIVKGVKASVETIQAIPFNHSDAKVQRTEDDVNKGIVEKIANLKKVALEIYEEYMNQRHGGFMKGNMWTVFKKYLEPDSVTNKPKNKIKTIAVSPKTQEAKKLEKKPDAVVAKAGQAAVNWGLTFFTPQVVTVGLPEICTGHELTRTVQLVVPDMRGGGGDIGHSIGGTYKIIGWEHTISVEAGFTTTLDLIPVEPNFLDDEGGEGGDGEGGESEKTGANVIDGKNASERIAARNKANDAKRGY